MIKPTNLVLGLNAFHGDSSACLLKEGKIIAAVEEERFTRIKHWAGFPVQSIRYCLSAGGLDISDIDIIAINQDTGANLTHKIGYALLNRPDLKLVLGRLRNRRNRIGVMELLQAEFPGQTIRARLQPVEHHLAHLASAFYCSPFDSAVAVSIDGFGDFASSAWGFGSGSQLEVEQRIYFPHSLGVFYQAMTQYLGFPNYGDEYKVMGLASYGNPSRLDAMRRIVQLNEDGTFSLNQRYFRHGKENIAYEWENGSPVFGDLFSAELEDLLGPRRDSRLPITQKGMDMACSVQAMYEEAFFHLLNALHQRHGGDCVAVAGGCGANSVANGRIRRNTPFKRIYVQAAAGDAGGALGSALAVWHSSNSTTREPMRHAYWGPEFSHEECRAVLNRYGDALQQAGCKQHYFSEPESLCSRVVDCIVDGGVVGWFQGRMEWGPRALGNRSILCDPRRSDMKDTLNLKIKRRESFRPFAPSVLREYVADWFEEDDDVPFMMKVYPIREERRTAIPAVTHVDGTGRLQTVHRETNPLYWGLIDTFRQRTGVPMLLNTSFNENEPIVCAPEEALDCFLRTSMDLLVLGNLVVARSQGKKGWAGC
jgi:carbamoyltransferase